MPLTGKMLNCKKQKNPEISKSEKSGFLELCKFDKSVTVDKLLDHLIVGDEPFELVLIDAVSECVAELLDDSVEARFGGVGLPTAIKYTHEVITYLSDLVTVQVHSGHTIVVVNDLGVGHTPIGRVLDGGVHQLLDLTHVMLSSVVSERGERISGDSEVEDILNLLTDCRGQVDTLRLDEIVAHLQGGLHVVDEGHESGAERERHGRLLEYLRSMAEVGWNCNP